MDGCWLKKCGDLPVLPYNKQQHYFFLHRRRPSRKNKQTLDAVFMLKPRYNYLQKKRGGQEEEEEVVLYLML